MSGTTEVRKVVLVPPVTARQRRDGATSASSMGGFGSASDLPVSATSRRSCVIPRYNEKTEADLAWDEIRREVEYRLNLWSAHVKMRKKNDILPKLQERFEDALKTGKILSFKEVLMEGAAEWLDSLVRELDA